MFKIETEEKQERLRKAQTSNLREWVKDLCKTDFWSEVISLNSWKENLDDSDMISLSNYHDTQEIHTENMEQSLFSSSKVEQNVLIDTTNNMGVRDYQSVHEYNGKAHEQRPINN
jgi:hypothetical protein